MKMLIGLLLLPAVAHAGDEDCKNAFEKGYAAGKEIQELRTEVRELRAMVSKLVALLGDKAELANVQVPPPPAETPEDKPEPAATKFGTVTGKISFLDGSKAAYVYVENVGGRAVRGKKIDMTQKNKQFAPRHLVVQKGTEVSFPNQDAIYHNVFAQSPAANFDLGIYRSGDAAKSYIFTRPGLVDIYCNMHSKMSAEVLVVPNHLYASVQPNGAFKLARVPEGRRKVVAWGPGAEPVSVWVEVSAKAPAEVKLSLVPRKKGAHTNKEGQPYGSYQ
jgi:plastocyanin